MYLYVDCLEREINVPQVFKDLDSVKSQLFWDFLDATDIDDDKVIDYVKHGRFEEAYTWLADNDMIDDENDINLDDNNLSAYCETRNHDNWDAKVFKLETTEFSINIKP